ncbi:MAG: PilT/PilU family type 4a pilus ATPase [Candidatus Hydrogenedentes bacterium]|nr:PilT/PilU family type 4a pilus ATPase [Candidatus Hydrogenedentota bacterium]
MDPNASHAATDNSLLRKILSYALEQGASDIHLKMGRPPATRVDGVLRFTKFDTLTRDDLMRILDTILGAEGRERFLHTGDADHALTMPGVGRYRVNCFRQRGTIAVVLRYVKSKIPTFSELNLPIKAMERIVSLPRGLVLITGTTSSGKSTTLAAILDRINEEREGHIVTLEDPIEYLHADRKCSVCQREVSIDTKDFKTGLRAMMREDPNVILIGEMRDVETFQTCIGAAETGHLVLSTLHTTNVMMTIDRILDLFPSNQQDQIRSQLALQLQAVVSQRLLPMAGGKGRVPAVEVMFNNPGVALLIRDNEIRQIPTAISAGIDEGMQNFNRSLADLVRRHMIDEETAIWASDNPEELKMNLQGIFTSRDRGGILKKPAHHFTS